MESMRGKWTDERLDDLSAKVDALARQMDLRFDAVDRRFEGIDRRFERVDERLDSMTRVMVQGFIVMVAAMATGFVTLAGLIVSH